MSLISLVDINAAAERIGKFVHHTPLTHSRTFSKMSGQDVYLKTENLQKTGSFKIRGATNKILTLSPDEAQNGIITASSGNHGQAVACAAKLTGFAATIVMPENGSIAKADSIRDYGAELFFRGTVSEERMIFAKELCEERKMTFVHPYDDPYVMAGQGTLALEILRDLPDVDVVLVPTGGCGLISGVAVAIKERSPRTKVYGVEPTGSNSTGLSFSNGRRTRLDKIDTVADGIRTTIPGELTFPVVMKYVDGMLLVTDDEILTAQRLILERSKLLAEPTGAVALAALLSGKLPPEHRQAKIVVVISGGNIAMSQLASYLQR